MSGWFAMKRGIHEHALFRKRPDRLFVWSWLLANAAWKPRPYDVDGHMITVQRGQLCVTQRQIEDATGVGRQAIRRLLNDLEAGRAIERKPATQKTKAKTLITICNYDKYQDAGTSKNQTKNQTATQQQPIKEQGNHLTTSSIEEDALSAPDTVEVSVLSKAVWDAGKPFLSSRGVQNPGAMIGRWLKTASPVEVLQAIAAAQKTGTQDPIPYITAQLNGGTNAQPSKQDQRMHAFISGARGSS